jgi:hypothetical protein
MLLIRGGGKKGSSSSRPPHTNIFCKNRRSGESIILPHIKLFRPKERLKNDNFIEEK